MVMQHQISNSVDATTTRNINCATTSKAPSKKRKNTINIRLKKDLLNMEFRKKDDVIPVTLPQIATNPRDQQMLKNMSRKSLTHGQHSPREDEKKVYSSRRDQEYISKTPEKGRGMQ